MSMFDKIFFGLILVMEVYYWFWWLPHNWRNNRECRNAVDAIKFMMKNGGKV